MSGAKHTPGPWHVRPTTGYGRKRLIVTLTPEHARGDLANFLALLGAARLEEAEANATLCSAAPDLLEALGDLLSYHDVPGESDPVLKPLMAAAFAAILKATGDA